MQKSGTLLAFFVVGAVTAAVLAGPQKGRVLGAAAVLGLSLGGALLARYAGPEGLRPSFVGAVLAALTGYFHAVPPSREPTSWPEILAPTRVSGTVDSVRLSSRGGPALVAMSDVTLADDLPSPPGLMLRWPRASPPPLVGDRIEAFGMLEQTVRGPLVDPVVEGNVVLRTTLTSRLRRSIDRIRAELAERADRSLSPLGADLTVSLCLGIDRDADDWRDHLARAGALHFFAVSGFQLAVLLVFLRKLTAFMSGTPRLRTAFLAFALVAYTAISGGEAPVLRALLMGLVLFAARMLRRPFVAGYALIVAAALQIAYDRETAGDVGFLLSMSAMAGLIWLCPPLMERPKRDVIGRFLDRKRRRPLAKYIEKNSVATIAAVLVTSPIAVGMFGVFHVAGLVGNLLLVPLVGGHFIVGLFLLAGVPCAPIVDFLASAIHGVVLWISDRPGIAYPTDPPFFVTLLHTVAVAAATLLAMKIGDRRSRPIIGIPIATLLICILWPASSKAPWIATQGDEAAFSIAIVDDASAMVLLAGKKDARLERSFLNRLKRQGVRTIEILVQCDADAADRAWRQVAWGPEVNLTIFETGATEVVIGETRMAPDAGGSTFGAGPFQVRMQATHSGDFGTRSLIVELGGEAIVLGAGSPREIRAVARSRGAQAVYLWRTPRPDEFDDDGDDDIVLRAPRSPTDAVRAHGGAGGESAVEFLERRWTIHEIRGNGDDER